MAIYLDKGRLYVQFSYKLQRYKRYLPKGATRNDAKKLETKMRSDLMFQAHGIISQSEILFEDFVLETFLPYCKNNLSAVNYNNADHICTEALVFLRGKTLRQIKTSDIEAFKNFRINLPTMHKRSRKPATIVRELSVLSKLFSLAQKDDLCDHNPVARIDRPRFDNVQNKVLARLDEPAFLAAFDKDQGQMARDICILVLNTGLRQNDALGLSDFQIFNGDTIRLVQGKTKRIVEIPLNAIAAGIVAKYAGKGLLFPSPRTGKPMHFIRKAISGACRRAKIGPVTIRDLRRTFATRLAEDGVDVLTIAMLLGHSDLRMVHRYARSVETKRKAVEKLQNFPSSSRDAKLRIAK